MIASSVSLRTYSSIPIESEHKLLDEVHYLRGTTHSILVTLTIFSKFEREASIFLQLTFGLLDLHVAVVGHLGPLLRQLLLLVCA